MSEHKPRLCNVSRSADGYGFHLHGEKGKSGQSIRKIEADSPADQAGLKVGDWIIEVNGKNVEDESHQQVVARIKERSGETDLLVVDDAAMKYFKEQNIVITQELITNSDAEPEKEESAPPEEEASAPPEEEASAPAAEEVESEPSPPSDPVRPRLLHLKRASDGYGFNLHSEKGKVGRFIRSIDEGGAAESAGLQAGDRIIEVNGINIESEKHSAVVNKIKESGDQVDFLVVDQLADDFFKSCEVTPTAEHVIGPLPSPKDGTQETPAQSEVSEKAPAAEAPAADAPAEDAPPSPASEQVQQSNGFDPLSMDLTSLKEKSRAGRKKAAPASNWNNRQAIFNNL